MKNKLFSKKTLIISTVGIIIFILFFIFNQSNKISPIINPVNTPTLAPLPSNTPGPYSLISSNPLNNGKLFLNSGREAVILNFNRKLPESSLKNLQFSISPEIELKFLVDKNYQTLYFSPSEDWKNSSTYTLTVSINIIEKPFSLTFTTIKDTSSSGGIAE